MSSDLAEATRLLRTEHRAGAGFPTHALWNAFARRDPNVSGCPVCVFLAAHPDPKNGEEDE